MTKSDRAFDSRFIDYIIKIFWVKSVIILFDSNLVNMLVTNNLVNNLLVNLLDHKIDQSQDCTMQDISQEC